MPRLDDIEDEVSQYGSLSQRSKIIVNGIDVTSLNYESFQAMLASRNIIDTHDVAVYVTFNDTNSASKARQALHGRLFAGKHVSAVLSD